MLVDRFYPEASKELILAALQHDVAEVFTGDTPFMAKRENPELKRILDDFASEQNDRYGLLDRDKLTPEESDALWVCDVLEAVVFAYEEVMAGNSWMKSVFDRADFVLEASYATPETVQNFLEELRSDIYGDGRSATAG